MHSVHYGTYLVYLTDTVFAIADNPTLTQSVLCRQHTVPATEMSYIHGRACILLLQPTRMEHSAFNTS